MSPFATRAFGSLQYGTRVYGAGKGALAVPPQQVATIVRTASPIKLPQGRPL